MKYLSANIFLFICLSLSGQFKIEPSYTYKQGNGCAIFGVDNLSCGCKCFNYDFEGQVRKVADVYDTAIFNNAQPTGDWLTCDLPDAADAGYLDDFSQEYREYIPRNDSSEYFVQVRKDYDTTWIVPYSVNFGLSSLEYSYFRIWDDGHGHILCNQPNILSPESYVDYGKRILRVKFLTPVNPYPIIFRVRFYRKTKMMHYHDRPPGYYVFFMRDKISAAIYKRGFVVTAGTTIYIGKSNYSSFQNELITIQ